jgi:hypothetical protein
VHASPVDIFWPSSKQGLQAQWGVVVARKPPVLPTSAAARKPALNHDVTSCELPSSPHLDTALAAQPDAAASMAGHSEPEPTLPTTGAPDEGRGEGGELATVSTDNPAASMSTTLTGGQNGESSKQKLDFACCAGPSSCAGGTNDPAVRGDAAMFMHDDGVDNPPTVNVPTVAERHSSVAEEEEEDVADTSDGGSQEEEGVEQSVGNDEEWEDFDEELEEEEEQEGAGGAAEDAAEAEAALEDDVKDSEVLDDDDEEALLERSIARSRAAPCSAALMFAVPHVSSCCMPFLQDVFASWAQNCCLATRQVHAGLIGLECISLN